METEEDFIINASGLFCWNSPVEKDVKLKITLWYNNLSPEEKEYIDILMDESAMEECFFLGGGDF